MFGIDDAIMAVAPSLIGGVMDIFGANQTNQTSRDLASQANAFSAQQYATRYQTTVKDLEAAGLNPMLAYGQGAGSPPSAVGIAQQVNPYQRASGYAQQAIGAANTAMQTQLTDAQVTEAISRVKVNDQMAKKLDTETALNILEMPNVTQKLKNFISEQLLNDARRTATNASELSVRALLPKDTAEGQYYKTYGIHPFELRDLATGVNSASNAINSVNPFKRGAGKNYPAPENYIGSGNKTKLYQGE